MTRHLVAACLVAACVMWTAPTARGQGATAEPVPERLPRAEVLRLFDAYAVVQAQEALQLDNASYGTFVSSYKALLETRRRHREARVRLVNDLGRLLRRGSPNEARLREQLKALQDHDAQAAADVAQSLAALDQSLTLEQRARFRVFEEYMEQRKLELLSRARAARGNRRGMGQ